ncbi:TspO/MBR family protein [Ferrovibrio terrae]|jgi:tryptophan-rich sensory protein|uniref:TspO/MBR family protein n=1 Tax=Ferrovibrio terrae TaxID=2594003 RepID=UPI003137E558
MYRRHTRHPVLSLPSLGALALSLIACFAISGLGGAITAGPVKSWYPTLAKPALTPPDLAFPIVWTLLYALMAIAAWLVWRSAGLRRARGALTMFGIQLLLNLAWSALFFGLQRPDLALAEIAILWAAIATTATLFWRHDRRAALLLAPYLAWVSFAVWLNAAIWWLNPA